MAIDPRPHPPEPRSGATAAPRVVDLDDETALDAALTGGKAAALARAHRSGVRTLPAAVVTTVVSRAVDGGGPLEEDGELTAVAERLGPRGRPLVARSSSVVEDQASSSLAGQFETVLGVHGPDELRRAVRTVFDSRTRAGAPEHPIAVLVQPMVEPAVSGVAFGVDPVTGRSDRRVVVAVRGQGQPLVSGEVVGSRWVLDGRARVLDAEVRDDLVLEHALLAEVVALVDRVAEVFGCPQDVEFGVVDGALVLFQSRPVTTPARGVPTGPVYGPGPVAETFPEPLSVLEQDLWVPPLREALAQALLIAGAVSRPMLEGRELVVVVDGRVALDLELAGDAAGRRPRGLGGRIRRLRSAWRVGRLRLALPAIADDLAAQVDRDLAEVPDLSELSTRQVVALIGRGREALRSLHAHEILMGMVGEHVAPGFSGASVALRVLVEARREGWTDEEILARSPVVLALVPPCVGGRITLPQAASAAELDYDVPETSATEVQRETLRLRVRWMQELVGQAAYEIGRRLAAEGLLEEATHVRHLRFTELAQVVARRLVPDREALARAARAAESPSPGLPARFRMGDRGLPIAEPGPGRPAGGTGAGGGVGRGPVTHDAEHPPAGSVLVVRTLSPQLGPRLGGLQGIVAETGSVLSHLAILARERGVATVVAYPGATELADGLVVTVDGQTGEVTGVDGAGADRDDGGEGAP